MEEAQGVLSVRTESKQSCPLSVGIVKIRHTQTQPRRFGPDSSPEGTGHAVDGPLRSVAKCAAGACAVVAVLHHRGALAPARDPADWAGRRARAGTNVAAPDILAGQRVIRFCAGGERPLAAPSRPSLPSAEGIA